MYFLNNKNKDEKDVKNKNREHIKKYFLSFCANYRYWKLGILNNKTITTFKCKQ